MGKFKIGDLVLLDRHPEPNIYHKDAPGSTGKIVGCRGPMYDVELSCGFEQVCHEYHLTLAIGAVIRSFYGE